ncbi:MAG: glycosyltransferase N-terminal domain-containing protein [Tenuifilaceae bacterium]|jgi:3-deoxy-D-manno-octulosonic-acid transferase|nr:glycosyltransferase N-terminal domain-containing protein [Bacteroidales bacterium]MDI9517141.1 glycosyltransferase N-terminal domain-containing protein [Bacteroidota bacterium]OQC65125.1 MAG: 3-deoxy-D-manno-octulosonic acid transferase [Bacteroidetes bacterium ADurb.Bin008]HNV80614.1 glycosyltransferase N-terminal domain-containing protein [Tenuifilaceae bacterium]MZP83101.1 3-deoxy-D-manno-octulosonic acid transferase [Bacteroidales bacterium]
MVILYRLGIWLYYFLIWIVSPFNHKASLWLKGRRRWAKRLYDALDHKSSIAWFHCASLGEFEQGRPLIEEYKTSNPEHKILITFFSPSGYEIRKNYAQADYVFYLPLDTKRNAKRFVESVNPVMAVFIKYEFWFFMLNELKRKGIPTYLVSAIFRPDQIFFRWYGPWNRKMLSCFNHIFVQNEISKQLLQSIDINNVEITGDTRFDRVYATFRSSQEIPLLDEFCKDAVIIIAGSTWPKDEQMLIRFINNTRHMVKIVFAPHEITESRITSLIEAINTHPIRFTKANHQILKQSKALIMDTIGILASAYKYGHIAYVGGGFGSGIHNTLEPATFGLPILFGPNYHKFQEAKELVERKAAFSIKNEDELTTTLNDLINNAELLKSAGKSAAQYVHENIGATHRVLKLISSTPS